MNTLVQIPFHGQTITAMSDEGKPLVSLRHMCESIGVDFAGQFTKLKNKSWATVVLNSTVAEDGKTRTMTMIDRRTMTMWLATIEPSRVNPEARPLLAAFQNEAADALDAYFNEGGAINPHATADQLASHELMARALLEAANVLKEKDRMIEIARPAVEYTKRFVSNEDAIIVSDFAAQYGITAPAMFKLLKDAKIVYRVKITEHFSDKKERIVEDYEYRAYATYLEFFDLRPQNKVVRYHNGKVRQTLYVRQAKALELGHLIGLTKASAELVVAL